MSLTWNGDEVKRTVDAAIRRGMKQTVSDSIREAKNLVHVKTSTLQGSIRMKNVEKIGSVYVLQWGSFDVNYALYQETLPPEKGGKAYLRPSADHNYPRLAGNIRAALR